MLPDIRVGVFQNGKLGGEPDIVELFPTGQPVEQHHGQNNDADDEDDADHPDQHHRQRGHPRRKMKHAITSVKPSGSGSGRLQ